MTMKIKKIFAAALAASMMVTMTAMTASASDTAMEQKHEEVLRNYNSVGSNNTEPVTHDVSEEPNYDINGDGSVTITDVTELLRMVVFGRTEPSHDLNGDSLVNIYDVVECLRFFVYKSPNIPESSDPEVTKMNIQIGNAHFTATLEDNAAVRELIEMMKEKPVTISMNDYSRFEKVGSLGRSLTTDDHQTTTSAGDIVLYNGNQIVMFYGSNSWSYTRIGKIDDLSGWKEALGSGSITAVFSL